mgnify:CR=1 FL=1|jgi:hypothetical protein
MLAPVLSLKCHLLNDDEAVRFPGTEPEIAVQESSLSPASTAAAIRS